MKTWREGGDPPRVSFADLQAAINNGHSMSYSDLRYVWRQMLIEAAATDVWCSTEGGLNPQWSFIEETSRVIEFLTNNGFTTSWGNIVFCAFRTAVPENWEYMFVVDLEYDPVSES